MLNIGTLLLLSCVDTDLTELKNISPTDPTLMVTPSEIHFGVVQPSTTSSEIITLRNEGTEAIELLAITLEGTGFTAASPAPLGWLEPGEQSEFWVDYTPFFIEDTGWVIIESNDPYAQDLSVPLSGQGAYPLLVLEPPLVDFGWTEPNVLVESGVTFRNEGLAELMVTETLLLGSEFDDPNPMNLPLTLNPGEEQWLELTYISSVLDEHTGSLWVQSNSQIPDSHVQLIGGSSNKPIAICDANPLEVTALRETTTWIGENSFDPSGDEINEYNWVIVEAPAGSTANIIAGPASSPNKLFRPDLEGSYTAKLVVHNEFGHASDPCFATIEATVQEDPCLDPNTEYDEHPQARLMVLDHALPLYVEFRNGTAGYNSELWLHLPIEMYLATGNQTPVGSTVNLQSVAAGSELKFRIDVLNTGDTFYSGAGSQNPDGRIHVAVTYLGECRWHIGFEDQFGGGDQDYDDINLIITGNLEMQL